ncbi:hypothetical protein [Pseudovibrio sp. Tun.PSC04-5.I4]|uniref:hypothetical protein n=1 Tax=Pseudovibrio sp. Tun.PSC04-5.I4 TaxID=1798213 RepID=UPI0008807C63|nr:hypothetical protein [Pseudovibrio sp. Tun.PSC04-5.I4]SDQ83943.1 hypothetical protein SAMN04515695_1598 [Pseudovibrio sp. Tun.PSC04-5.I4]
MKTLVFFFGVVVGFLILGFTLSQTEPQIIDFKNYEIILSPLATIIAGALALYGAKLTINKIQFQIKQQDKTFEDNIKKQRIGDNEKIVFNKERILISLTLDNRQDIDI